MREPDVLDPRSGSGRADSEPVTITECPNGPLLVRGGFELRRPDGDVERPRRRVVALCRCGVSTIKPFCDGTHKLVGFRTEPPSDQG